METSYTKPPGSASSVRNACKLCSPLGASIVFKGIQGCVPMIHGSQGCATYIRRYIISHYKEPVDIASSNFSEETTIFGGHKNFNSGLDNIIKQYKPEVIGIASACLSETIGEDLNRMIKEYQEVNKDACLPDLIYASTPGYQGTHIDGFHETVSAAVATLAANETETGQHVNIFPGFVSPQDIRHLKEILNSFCLGHVLFPDYSDSLDNPNWQQYHLIPPGGTPVAGLRRTGTARATIEFGYILNEGALNTRFNKNKQVLTAGEWLETNRKVPYNRIGMPIGIKETDRFFDLLEKLSQMPVPQRFKDERGRLVDAYVDGHKYLFGKKAIVYGEEDLVIGLVLFLLEIGIEPVLIATGGTGGRFKQMLNKLSDGQTSNIAVMNDMDFESMNEVADELKPDIMIGHSKGYYIARRLGIPLVRVGFPVHDRFGAQRMQHLGYEGALQLFDRITNALIEFKQEQSPIGYKYM
ncbi:MAG: nitrogenase component 1 [Sphingobacteriales bacterium]